MSNSENIGLIYRKMDLHIHTPASECFEDKTVTPEQIVQTAIDKGLDAIAITDHNTGEWIDRVKEAAKGKIVVFPGVELSVTGGQKGIHIIGLFNLDATTKDIENLLGDLKIRTELYGEEEAISPLSPNDVINNIAEHRGIAIAAHSNTKKGITGALKGQQRIIIVRNENLLAAELTDLDKENSSAAKFDGNDPLYKRKLAYYQSSDNLSSNGSGKHCLDGIASRYSYFKMDEISLEGLRQCFCDPDIRIKQMECYEENRYPKILEMEITGGFFDAQKIKFHGGLNSIIGGKGVGKSLLIEFLRFGLSQSSSDNQIKKDHISKIEKRLGEKGTIKIKFEIHNGEQYLLTGTCYGHQSKFVCTKINGEVDYDGDIKGLFPILAYSQNEVINIAYNEVAQLELIDSFIDFREYNSEIERLVNSLIDVDRQYIDSYMASSNLKEKNKDLSTLKEQLANLDRELNMPEFDQMKIFDNKKNIIDEIGLIFPKANVILNEYKANIEREFENINTNGLEENDSEIKKLLSNRSQLRFEIVNSLECSINKCTEHLEINNLEMEKWLPFYMSTKSKYEQALDRIGGNIKESERKRKSIANSINKLKKECDELEQKANSFTALKNKRNQLLDGLDSYNKKKYEVRKKKYEEISELSENRLKLTLEYSANRTKYFELLKSYLSGSNIRYAIIQKVTEKIMPRELIALIIAKNSILLSEKCDISDDNADKIIALIDDNRFNDIASMCYNSFPEDTPKIEYKREDGSYSPLDELSVGQKCSALLIIALCEGKRPVIIDQPEDSLDNPSIYEDIVRKLRFGKEKRQFIITTHNSCVGVVSDSDNFIVLESTANKGKVKCRGAIDRSKVRTEVVQTLEGGNYPYELKSKKYNIKSLSNVTSP